jgi:prephenate dehydratase
MILVQNQELSMPSTKIAFQGEPGANSQIACTNVYPHLTPLPCDTFEDAFAAVRDGQADLGMIPIENSIAGRVADIYHLLPKSGLYIVGEYFLPIHFQLMAVPGATLQGIKSVRSHVMALGQCRNIIRNHKWKAVVTGDTAGAAREVRDMQDVSVAALAPRIAAPIYGLSILAENVEDNAHNTTRFVILSRERRDAAVGNGKTITSFVFSVRNVPAALYKAMGGFATNGVNMTKLESYMVNGDFNATQFYIDVEGHPDDKNVALALEELRFFTTEVIMLGTYPASEFRA